MGSLYEEARSDDIQPLQRVWYGEIASNPADLSTLVDVIIPGIDDSLRWKKLRWQSRNDVDVPHRGDKCLVIFDDLIHPWVVAWWPF